MRTPVQRREPADEVQQAHPHAPHQDTAPRLPPVHAAILRLEQDVGNRAVTRLVTGRDPAATTVGRVGALAAQHADPSLQRQADDEWYSGASGGDASAGDQWSAGTGTGDTSGGGDWSGGGADAGGEWSGGGGDAGGEWSAGPGADGPGAGDPAGGDAGGDTSPWDTLGDIAGKAWDAVSGGVKSLVASDDGAGGAGDSGAEGSGPGSGGSSHPTVSRPLTSSEIDYATQFFGSEVDYGAIQITRWSLLAEDGTSRTVGNTINLADSEFVLDTLDLTGAGLSTLIHEMTHVYQSQRGDWVIVNSLWEQFWSWVKTGERAGAYDWRPLDDAGVPWDDWNVEQQAQLVEDYQMALRAQEGGTATGRDLDTIARAGKYINKIKTGPRGGAGGAGGAPSGAGGAPSP